jgi:mono/diheme cytochrome c family protein
MKVALAVAAVVALLAALGFLRMVRRGFSAHDEPSAIEAVVARSLRGWSTPAELRDADNPLPPTPEVLAEARWHWADHCATCHGNDGKGQTTIGEHLYPRAPDMTLPRTQELSDGELFAIIENGVRLTGMPAWGQPGPEDDRETWELVHLIRRLTQLTADELAEMESLNPRSRKDFEEEDAIRRFLAGEDAEPPAGSRPHDH